MKNLTVFIGMIAFGLIFVTIDVDAAKVCGDTLCTKIKSCDKGEVFDKITLSACQDLEDGR